MKITEQNAIPTGIEAQDVKKGMRIKRHLSDEGYVTVDSRRKNVTTGKIAIVTRTTGRPDTRLFTTRHNPCETLYFFDVDRTSTEHPLTQAQQDYILRQERLDREVEQAKGQVEMLTRQTVLDIRGIADWFESKAKALREMADSISEGGTRWAPQGFESVASRYADIALHNSYGKTSSVAMNIARAASAAAVLTAITPERHRVED